MMRGGVTEISRELARQAFDAVVARWPDEILPGEKSFHLSGCNMRALNETHWPIEEWATETDFGTDLDAIIGTAEWTVFQLVHGALKNLTSLPKSSIDFEAFVSRLDGLADFRVR